MKSKIKLSVAICFLVMMVLAVGREAGATSGPAVTTYDELLLAIRQAKAQSRDRIEALVEQEKVREAWEIGKLIDTHVLQHKERAEYGEQVLFKLAKDLETSHTELKYQLRFARAYPIRPPAAQLSWSHYRELLSLDDPREREEVTKQAAREHWGRDQLREEVRRRLESKKQEADKKDTNKDVIEEIAEEVLTATPGKPGTYRVVKAYYGKKPDQLVLDLGFSSYYRPPGKFPFKEGDIVKIVTSDSMQDTSDKTQDTNLEIASDRNRPRNGNDGEANLQRRAAPTLSADAAVVAQQAQLFTYSATVIRVIDGDTFSAAVDLGFGFTTVQTLRLRALDAPEIESTSGREAKEFLERKLPKNSSVLIKTVGSDKYDRYLADVFGPLRSVKTSSSRTQTTGDEYGDGEYINQELVEQGLAVPVAE